MTEVVNNNSLELTSDSGQQQSTITDVSTGNVNEYYPVKALYENVSDIIEKQNYVEHNETDFDELTANLGLPLPSTDVSTGNVNDYYPVEASHENIAGTIEKQNYVEYNVTDFDELTANLGLPLTTTDVSTGNVNDYYPVEALHENIAGTIEKQNYVGHNVTDFDELTAILDQQSATTGAFNQNFNKSYSIETLYKDLSEVIELQNVVAQDCDDANVDILTTDLDQQSSRTGSLFESDTETQDRYPGLRPKTKNVKPVSNDSSVSSDYSEYDSDYVPQSNKAVSSKLYDSDKEEDKDFANSSDINIDEYED
ncbi:uncharacterized protein LOC126555694 [Aphis gossypii]|uniref:uncharacterized protein LOC126555694 n=1 Tax=Aphis gossypii TaxID=80765 RepID=UPI00215963FD|nr:uncharacterized protein LOC126555694 [Aphis gossypii]